MKLVNNDDIDEMKCDETKRVIMILENKKNDNNEN